VEPVVSPVTFNAVKHGIYSVSPVVPWFESEADWLEFRGQVFEEIRPQGGLQMALADRVATLLWRLMRIVRYEREVVTGKLMDVERDFRSRTSPRGDEPTESEILAARAKMERMGLGRLLPDDATLNKIMRYESRLHRHVMQTLHQIALLQGDRRRAQTNFDRLAGLTSPYPAQRSRDYAYERERGSAWENGE
jgi:hypothetical protein